MSYNDSAYDRWKTTPPDDPIQEAWDAFEQQPLMDMLTPEEIDSALLFAFEFAHCGGDHIASNHLRSKLRRIEKEAFQRFQARRIDDDGQ